MVSAATPRRHDRRQRPHRRGRAAVDMKDRPKDELEALRAIDPRVAVEGGAVAPQAGDLPVTALVGGERRAEERGADGDGQDPGEGDGEPLGPAARGDRRARPPPWPASRSRSRCVAQVLTFGLSLTPDRYVLVLLAPALVIGRGRRFLLDFVPFVVLIVLYEECRGIAHTLHPHPYYAAAARRREVRSSSATSRRSTLQDWLWTGSLHWYDQFLSAMTRVHFIVPPTLAFALWLKRRALFYRFAATLLVLSYAGALTFWLFPAAPPWAASERGLIPFLANPAGVQAATSPLPTDSGPLYRLVDGNPYAAVPSLHGGLLAARLPVRRDAGLAHPLALVGRPSRPLLYPVIQTIAVVYTGNHYVVDLLIGFVYATSPCLRRAPVLALAGMAGVTGTAVEPPSAPGRDRPSPAGRAGWLATYRYPLTVFAASRVAVYALIAAASWTSRVPRESGISWHALFGALGQWDAVWYRWIADHGYDPAIGHGNAAAFFPLYPLAWRPFSILPGRWTLWGSLLSTAALRRGALRPLPHHRSAATTRRWRGAPCSTSRSSRSPSCSRCRTPRASSCCSRSARSRSRGTGGRGPEPGSAPWPCSRGPSASRSCPRWPGGRYRQRRAAAARLPPAAPAAARRARCSSPIWAGARATSWRTSTPRSAAGSGASVCCRRCSATRCGTTCSSAATCGSSSTSASRSSGAGSSTRRGGCGCRREYLIYAALLILLPTSGGLLVSIGRFGMVAFPLFWALAELGESEGVDTLVKTAFPMLLAALVMITYTAHTFTP